MRKYLYVFMIILGIVLLPQLALAAEDVVRSGDITISAEERVLGDVVSLQGNIEIYGEVYGDVVSLLGEVTIHPDAFVHGDVVSLTGAVDLRPGGTITGDQVSLGGVGKAISLPSPRNFFNINLGRTVFNIMVRILLAVLIGLLFPTTLARVSAQVESRLGPSLGLGTLTWLAVLPLTVIVALTIIGIPLSLLALLALWAAYQMGFAAVSQLAGRKVFPNLDNTLANLALGALMLSILLAIPLLGMLVRIALALAGVGAVVTTRFGTREAA